MSAIQELGGCLWKLFQLGVVVAILLLGFLFISRPRDADRDAKGETKAGAAVDTGKKKESGGGLIAKLRNLGKANDERKKKEDDTMQKAGGTQKRAEAVVPTGESSLVESQADVGAGHADLARLIQWTDDKNVQREVGMLADGTTGIEQLLFWQIVDGVIYYRIILQPYDRPAHKLMMAPGEALFMSFLSKDNTKLAPRSSDQPIEMRSLRVATRDGYAVGWFYDGRMSLGGVAPDAVDHGKIGWVFSSGLHARLREIQAPNRRTGSSQYSVNIPLGGKQPAAK